MSSGTFQGKNDCLTASTFCSSLPAILPNLSFYTGHFATIQLNMKDINSYVPLNLSQLVGLVNRHMCLHIVINHGNNCYVKLLGLESLCFCGHISGLVRYANT